jgi:hypothetical protein
MLDTFQGLPVHSLIVHATVVVVPVAALTVALAAVYPRFRNWIGWFPPAAAVASIVLVQLTTMSGKKLYARFERAGFLTKDIQHHRSLGNLLIWLVIPMALIAIAAYVVQRRDDASKVVVTLVAVLAVVSAGTVSVDVALIGHAGAKASWKPIIDGLNSAK